MAKDIIDVAIGELGYKEQGSNHTKYGKWIGADGLAWCHSFVSWCAYKAGASTSVFPKTASTDVGMAWFKKKGRFKAKGKYTPKRGDVVYFKTGRSHVGLVEKVKGNTLHTIEGNTSDKVARRTYSLNDPTITGYGVPAYTTLNDKNQTATTKKSSKKELSYLRSVLKKKETTKKTVVREVLETNKISNENISVLVTNGKKRFFVPVQEGLKIEWERKGTPGKMTFKAKYDKKNKIVEGNSVLFAVGSTKMFYGFVFSREMSKDGFMSYTVYDQLRYLKNKETMIYKQKTADELIKLICERFKLRLGTLAKTGYRRNAIEDSTTLFDIIQNALDDTLLVKGKVYTLYDKVGKICLSAVSGMKVNSCLIDKETGEDFTYRTSIDSDVYNQIKLIYENKQKVKKGKKTTAEQKTTYEIYMTKSSASINKWGVLQYVDKIDSPDIGKAKSKALLKLYNRKQRTLSIKGVVGNKNVRAGSLVPVILDLQDIKISNYMLVEKVTHTFNNREHTMDLTVSGGDFVDG